MNVLRLGEWHLNSRHPFVGHKFTVVYLLYLLKDFFFSTGLDERNQNILNKINLRTV